MIRININIKQLKNTRDGHQSLKLFGNGPHLDRRSKIKVRVDSSGYLIDISSRTINQIALIGSTTLEGCKQAVNTQHPVNEQNGMFQWVAAVFEFALKVINNGLKEANIPYSFGFSIILLTFSLKILTFPLAKIQVESSAKLQELQPELKKLQTKYNDQPDVLQKETAKLYQRANANPLTGCLPALISVPVFIGLYNCLQAAAQEGILQEKFFFIPSLAGPTSIMSKDLGAGMEWLFPFEDGQPPLGWQDTLSYLALPMLIVITQSASFKLMSKAEKQNSGSVKFLKALPFLIGYFSLNVPAGLSLYWLTNNIFNITQQAYLQSTSAITAQQDVNSASSVAFQNNESNNRLQE